MRAGVSGQFAARQSEIPKKLIVMERYVPIGEAAEILGVSIPTVRRWVRSGKIDAAVTQGKHRRFDITKLKPELAEEFNAPKRSIAYARVSNDSQLEDLKRQQEILELFCARNGWEYELLSDIGSGLNLKNKGFQKLVDLIMAGKVSRLVVTHKDRLLRIGIDLLLNLCKAKDVKVIVLNKGEDTVPEKDLGEELRELVAAG